MSQTPETPARPQPAWDRRTRPAGAVPPPATEKAKRTKKTTLALCALSSAIAVAGCAGLNTRGADGASGITGIAVSEHSNTDDLLTAGLGEAGLRSATPPAFANADDPTAGELRRRAIWTNWRGIADLAPGGGYATVYGTLAPVPGREYTAFATLPGRSQPHRVLVQLPDRFDLAKRCVIVTASSGSRGIYGSISLAGAWGLPRGCAVAYTDKGTGTGYVDTTDGVGIGLDGRRAPAGAPVEFSVSTGPSSGVAPIAIKHAHSGDNPEADWGRHLQQAAQFALEVLDQARPQGAPWNPANTRVIAVGVSNGGGAVLRAAELPGDWLDAAVAVSPNVLPANGGRALYDYGTEAALWMTCALNAPAFDGVLLARPGGAKNPAGIARCASLHASADIAASEPEAQAREAHEKLKAQGWTDAALTAGAISTAFDLWRAVNVTYASAYARTGPGDMPCGYRLAALAADGSPRATTAAERSAWWSDGSGIAPGAGVGIVDTLAAGSDTPLPGLRCLRALWNDAAGPVRASVAATTAGLPRAGLPVIVVHGVDDGLVPEAFSGGAYAPWAKANGRAVSYWAVENAQHFDAFLGLPALGMRYVPMMPFGYRALDAAWSHVADGTPLPGDARIRTTPRVFANGALAPLAAENLGTLP
ncbi:MAG: D-(-)-3-hydroxybutyrate oligomer hydrolase [Arenimonas sp.]|uniref:3-hydroxybutyrate oligomer hydrolase family protein n=1 Tax=Arenimonas sp. TaxID=1872635 RepID=UPI0025BB3439|nr:3-hydroxybutyrate oligomer hydrolase family protein [Arenimonas sp.]MBW8366259.1 D-(-)-3-hydroxybutyrate oligomer hydrolase [Arenimonas sp.]